jgi:hypothetical protein
MSKLANTESIEGIVAKIDTEEGTRRDPEVPIGDSAMTHHALNGFRALMKRCQLSVDLLMAKTSPSDVACSGTVAPDKVLPCLSLLESALNSVCLSKYAAASKDSIASAESGKRKAPCIPHVQFYIDTNSQKRKVQLGSVRLR